MNDSFYWFDSVYSDGSKNFVSNPCPKKGETVSVFIRMFADAPVENVFLSGKRNGTTIPVKMKKVFERDGLAYFSADVCIYENEFSYQFFIATENHIYYYDQAGMHDHILDEGHNFRILTDYVQPEWVKNAVFYQIFPERFCNGDDSLSVKDNEYIFDGFPATRINDWSSVPQDYENARCLDFYGGDLIGIKQKIPYFKRLGVTALYLNPIFYAATVHKYDCLDYFHVDPHFGGDKALEELVSELHKNGMKIILDVSINHTGIANRWFNRDGTFFPKTEGAYNNPDSEEREYYFFNKDNSYKAWFDVPTLPTLNYASEKLRCRIWKDKDSVVKKWLRKPFCIDGWRFDVADTMARNDLVQLHHDVWPQIRQSIKEENPQGYILAEDWTDCRDFLNGDEWDSPMNYFGSCRPIRAFYGQRDFFTTFCPELRNIPNKLSALSLAEWIGGYLARLPFVIQQVLFNLLDSHDISRFHNDHSISEDAVQGAVKMLFTLPGCTNVYYGDEADIAGRMHDNEGCRYTMPWDRDIENLEIYRLYSKLCRIKTSSAVFCDGGFRIVWAKDQVFAFARFTEEELWITVASSDEHNRKIRLPLAIFGRKFLYVPERDALGESLEADLNGDFMELLVPAGKSYLIKIA